MAKAEKDVLSNINKSADYVEVWEDVVSIKDLILSLVISGITTLGAYLLAPNESSLPLFFGLGGAILGFIISSILIKPKRNIVINEEK